MDQPSEKFDELSPVLELIYVSLTNMVRYLDIYATDIEATNDERFQEAKAILDETIKKLDTFYGVDPSDEDEAEDALESKPVADAVVTPSSVNQPYEFSAGEDEESMQKAKQAVEELKSLFSDMKAKETELAQVPAPVQSVAPAMAAAEMPVPEPVVMAATPAPIVTDPQQVVAPVQVPSPMNTPQPAKDATEIDSILAELRKLQNKGTQQL